MKKRTAILGFIMSFLIASTAYGSQVSQKIDAVFDGIKIMVNNQKVQANNILYNGTTYVPLRAISEILNKEVVWDAQNSTAHINDKDEKQELPIVTIEMNNSDKIKMELYPDMAPNTVKNFISLANKGFYNGLIFHRVIPDFVIQGGDPDGNGQGGPGYRIKGEFMQNGVPNSLMNTRGVVAMARTQDPNSAGSQFFIVVKDANHLNGEYAAFGRVIEGMEIVDKIVGADRDASDKPKQDQIMKKVSVDTFGKDYGDPEIIK